MIIIVTGQAGVGKTTILEKAQIENTYYADDYVKNTLYTYGTKSYKKVAKQFPEAINNQKIDIKILGKIIFNDAKSMFKINKIIKPFIIKWLKSFKGKNVIIEMANYINTEKFYKKYIDKVILITRNNRDISNKFNYLNHKKEPITLKEIETDFVLENNGSIDDVIKKFKEVVKCYMDIAYN